MALGVIKGKEATKNRIFGHILCFLRDTSIQYLDREVGMTTLQVICSLAEVNASVFVAVF